MSRGNAKMCIFTDDADYRQFVYLLGDVVEQFNVRCWNYCLMPNHYHAILQPMRPNLSLAIRHLNGVYGYWWNRRHGRIGHVFQGRFKAQIVDRETYVFALSRYVAMNPVRAGLTERPEDWQWSSYRAVAGLAPTPAFVDSASTLRLFGEAPDPVLQARFVEFVADQSHDPGLIDRIRSNERILGGKTFKESIASSAGGVSSGSGPGLTLV